MTPARPIGTYQHPRPVWVHRGHKRRLDIYIRGGLTNREIARLTGMHDSTVRARRIKLRGAA